MNKHIPLLLFVLCTWCLASYAQTTVRGVVTDYKSKSPVPGATVEIKRSKTATMTGNDGSYEIIVPSNATTLIFHNTGYRAKEVVISG